MNAMRSLRRACAAAGVVISAWAWLVATPGVAAAADDDKGKDPIAEQAEDAFWWGDLDTLERLYADAAHSPQRNPYNGWWPRQSVRSGIVKAYDYRNANDAYFIELERMTEQWARERPASVLAQLLYVRTLLAHAWHVRGTGFWAGVPPQARRTFVELLAKAEAHVAARAPLMMQDSATHLYLVMIGRAAGWSFERQYAVAEDGLARSVETEEPLYSELVFSLLPKWGGNWPDVARFVDTADARTRDRRGHELYALLWSSVVGDLDTNPFRQVPTLQWPWLREGLERLSAQRALPYYANRLAYFACQAEDRDSARAAMARLNGKPSLEDWRGGGAAGRQNYEACQRWLNDKSSEKPGGR